MKPAGTADGVADQHGLEDRLPDVFAEDRAATPAIRAPIALGGGRSTKGMPAPRVAASQRIRIQAPKIAGISRRRNELSTSSRQA